MGPAAMSPLEPWCELVRSDLGELQSVRLSVSQARLLWGMDDETCRRVLQALVDDDFLVRLADGRFCRSDRIDGEASID
jgi:hypothetical protein